MIDADYRGEVRVLLFNHSEVAFDVKEGERVAQLVLERVSYLSAWIGKGSGCGWGVKVGGG